MIVITQSLDISIAAEKLKGSFEETKQRYEIFKEYDRVTLLTQDMQDLSHSLSEITHVPCAFSKSRIVSKVLSQSSYVRWFHFFLKSFIWLVKNRKLITVMISENIDSPAPLIMSILFKTPYIIYYRYDVGSQVKWINKRSIIGTIIMLEERFAFKRANGLWVTSPHLASMIKSFGRKKRIAVIPNWLTPMEICEEQTGQYNEKRIAEQKILFVGRLHPVKRVDLLIHAFNLLHEKYPNLNLYLLGDGPERQRIEELVDSLELGDRTYFLGFVDKLTVLRMMKQSNLLVLCSEIEGNPRVLLEAMIYKVPIVATKVPGITDMIQHEETGFLVDDPQPQNLANAIENVLTNRELSTKMIDQAYVFAMETFSKENAVKKIGYELSLLRA